MKNMNALHARSTMLKVSTAPLPLGDFKHRPSLSPSLGKVLQSADPQAHRTPPS